MAVVICRVCLQRMGMEDGGNPGRVSPLRKALRRHLCTQAVKLSAAVQELLLGACFPCSGANESSTRAGHL